MHIYFEETSEGLVCRVCYQDSSAGRFISPCLECHPESKYVHFECFKDQCKNYCNWWHINCKFCKSDFEGIEAVRVVQDRYEEIAAQDRDIQKYIKVTFQVES